MSRAFRFLIDAREKFYETGILKTLRLGHPVISIGNLTLGGTGKTPLVIALAQRLRADGLRPVVLSRGYRRSGSGIVVAGRGGGPLVGWNECGDEPFLIAKRAIGAAVVVGSDRHAAGRLAEREGLGNIFILDDGFQHRRLARNVDIVTIDPAEWAAGERLLPAGRWREPKSALERAHLAVVGEGDGPLPDLPVPAFRAQIAVDGLYDGDQPVNPETLRGRTVVAFAGIAKPERFFAALERLGVNVARRARFRDHHAYTAAEIRKLGGDVRITTEKDAVRLDGLGETGFLHLRISVTIPELDRMMSLIHSRLSGCP
jgi:tetraacyldisaccharide 4'-kinase